MKRIKCNIELKEIVANITSKKYKFNNILLLSIFMCWYIKDVHLNRFI